jgi:pyruvate dehydrogenase E2 component (dihydrolipoamide acetyltransferase)
MAEIVTMPKLGFDMAEGTLVRWVINEGEEVAKGAILAEIETDKATVEVESAYDGVVYKHLVSTGETVPINEPIAVVSDPDEEVDIEELLGAEAPVEKEGEKAAPEPAETETPKPDAPPPSVEAGKLPGGVKASPLARRMADEMNIDLKAVDGSGPGGRIVKKDIESYVAEPAARPAAAPAPPKPEGKPEIPPISPLPSTPTPETESVPLDRLRAAIGRRMTEAKQQVPHFYVTHQYDMGPAMALRKDINTLLPDEEKISVNDFIIKAVALALRQYPNLNASLSGDEIIRHGEINIGVAVAVEGGLLTVVCHNTDRKALRQIATEVRTKANRAREGKVRPDDVEGSTFSVSNMGMFDVEHFIAIINPPEAAILAVGSAKQIPVVEEGEVTTGWRMKATISADHRVTDGAEAARLLQTLADYLEAPLTLLV